MRLLGIYLVLLLFNSFAAAQPPTEAWMNVLLDGRKIGHMQSTRVIQNEHVISTQKMDISLERAGIKIGLLQEETSEETWDGKPIAFSSHSKLSGIETVVSGKLREDDQMEIVSSIGGAQQTRVLPWPKGALLAEGLRLSAIKAGLKPNTQFSDLAFESASLTAVPVTNTVHGEEWVDLPSGRRQLHRIEQDLSLGGSVTHARAWVDAEQTVHKVIMPILGFDLTMIESDQATARLPNQSTQWFEQTFLAAPQALTAETLSHGIVFTLRATDNGEPLIFASTDEQRVQHLDNGNILLQIAPLTTASPRRMAKPVASDDQPNDWLQSQAPEIVSLARQAVGNEKSLLEQMNILEKFVRSYIHKKNLSVGYASALEVARSREGDCTEHAVLLSALGRSLGIPTHVVSGLAYTDHYAGAEHVFVPHAWAQAWVNNHWQSFDAALHGFDAGHIALSVGDGDPWRFYAGLNTLGRARLLKLEPLPTKPSSSNSQGKNE